MICHNGKLGQKCLVADYNTGFSIIEAEERAAVIYTHLHICSYSVYTHLILQLLCKMAQVFLDCGSLL